uniref:1-phosphatidylinositol 4-kinase n=1 Tax=Anthurium amnicola TaxID=1678845 RepID=A0A1D1Y5N9_9ARAE
MSSAGIALSPLAEDPALSPIRFDGSRSLHCAPESIVIYLSFSSGSPAIPLQVLASESIASVKLRIQTFKGFVVKRQKLVFDGRELARNDSMVRDYGVCDGNMLHLVIRLSDLRTIAVKTTFGREYKFHVERSRNVGYIKQQIAQTMGGFTSLGEQKLVCNGEELDDQCLIEDICDDKDAVIRLLVHKSAKVRANPVGKEFELSVEASDLSELTGFEDLQISESKQLDKYVLIEPVIVNPKAELPSVIRDLISAAFAGLKEGNSPVRTSEGSGGAYFMQDISGQKHVAVFKPIDEEPMAVNNPQGLPLSRDGEGLKSGTRVGEGALREVAAYLLDHPIVGHRSFSQKDMGFSGIPPTVMIRCLHEGFNHPQGYNSAPENVKIGSLQMFVDNIGTCEDMGPRAFPVEEVHKISVLDIRLANADRHGGNILVCKEDEGKLSLIPIDHGYCLPENFEDCTFEWLYWPQARVPYNAETIEYIRSLDAEEDIALLKFHGWELSLECARTLRISTMLLKMGVEKGLTPFSIGSIMCRETLKKKSVIEDIVDEAKESVLPESSEAAFLESVSEVMERRLNELSR